MADDYVPEEIGKICLTGQEEGLVMRATGENAKTVCQKQLRGMSELDDFMHIIIYLIYHQHALVLC